MEEFKVRVAEAKESVSQMLNNAQQYADAEVQAMDGRPARTYLYGVEILAARDHCVQSIQAAATSFLSTCDDLILIQGAVDREVDQAFGFTDGHALDFAYNAGNADELAAKIRAMAGRYANQIEGVRRQFDAAWGTLESEYNMQFDHFKESVADAHDISVDVLDAAVNTAQVTRDVAKVALVGGAIPAVTAAAVVFTTAFIAVSPALLAIKAAGEAATSVWNYFDRS